MSARFDMQEGKMDSDEEGILEAVTQVRAFIAEEIKAGTPANRIVLAGFSQGAALTLLAGFTDENRLAGLLALSGGLPANEKFVSVCDNHIFFLIRAFMDDSSLFRRMRNRCPFFGLTGKMIRRYQLTLLKSARNIS
jgi:predicted esterase